MIKLDRELVIVPVSQIPAGEGRTFVVEGEHIALFHTREGRIFAVQAICPHKGGPLADGLVGGTTVICPLHSYKFDLATGAGLNSDCSVRTYPVRLDEARNVVITL